MLWNGVGPTTYLGVAGKGVTGLLHGDMSQFLVQLGGATLCAVYAFTLTFVVFKIVNAIAPMRVISSSDSNSTSVRPSRANSRSSRNRRTGLASALNTRSSSSTHSMIRNQKGRLSLHGGYVIVPRGKQMTVVTFTLKGKYKVSGFINDQNLLEKVDTWLPNPVLGDMLVETTYSDYKDFAGVKFPSKIVQTQSCQ